MEWKISRDKAKEVFDQYVSHYNLEDNMIRLKVEHTYRVAELCEQIAHSLKLSEKDVDLAWLIGLLHDIGRFEQQKNYHTFNDALSIDHAKYGADILFSNHRTGTWEKMESENEASGFLPDIRDFVESDEEDRIIETAVSSHSAFRIPEGLDERTAMFANIIRDADKIDILKVNVEFSLEEIYNVSTQELYSCQVTPEVMESFEEEHAVLRSLKKTAVDNVVGHISLAYELVFSMSRTILKKQGYLERLMNFTSENPVTREQFAHIREKMEAYLNTDNQADKARQIKPDR